MADTNVSVDNPFAESFNRTLKVEEVHLKRYETVDEAQQSIGTFINDSSTMCTTQNVFTNRSTTKRQMSFTLPGNCKI